MRTTIARDWTKTIAHSVTYISKAEQSFYEVQKLRTLAL